MKPVTDCVLHALWMALDMYTSAVDCTKVPAPVPMCPEPTLKRLICLISIIWSLITGKSFPDHHLSVLTPLSKLQ